MQVRINNHDILPKEALPTLSSNEKKYLLLLEFHESFPARVLSARESLGIKTNTDGTVNRIIPDPIQLIKKTDEIVTDLYIPAQLATCIKDIVETGEVFTATRPVNIYNIEHQTNRRFLYSSNIRPRPDKITIQRFGSQVMDHWYASNKEILSIEGTAPAYPLIQINKRLSIDELKQAIDDNSEEIELAMDDFEKSVPYFVPIQEFTEEELKYSMIIYRMRQESPKVSHEEIRIYLKENYSCNYEEATIRQKNSDFKKMLKKIGFIK